MSAAVESVMDVSIGSDGERSTSSMCGSPPVSPSDVSPPLKLKFSIANILRPEFGKLEKESMKRPESASSLPGTPCSSLSPADLVNPKTLASAMAMSRPPVLWPAWVYCTRYSDRPSSGPRCRRIKRKPASAAAAVEEKRPRTAFTSEQLNRLKTEFTDNRYLTEKRRQELAHELGLNESQIKIWFQNKRAKIKKAVGQRPPLALHLMAQGLYNHATVPIIEDD